MNKTPDSTFGQALLEKKLREDRLGVVWRATDRDTGEPVDVRLVPSGDRFAQLKVVAERAAELSHPKLVRVLRFDQDGDRCGIVQQPCDGESISVRRSRRTRSHFEVSELKPWAKSLVECLSYIHQNGQVHGAIHPGSIFVDGPDIQLGDLGLHPLVKPSDDGTFPIPLPTVSPDALDGAKLEPADDVYALAAVFYDLLTGRPVFYSGDIASQVGETVPPSVAQRREELGVQGAPIPGGWEAWLAAALSKDRASRPGLLDLLAIMTPTLAAVQTPSNVAGSAPAAHGNSVGSTIRTATAGAERFFRGNPKRIAAAVAALAVLGIVFALVIPREEAAPPATTAGDDRGSAVHSAFDALLADEMDASAEPQTLIKGWRDFQAQHQTAENLSDAALANLFDIAEKRIVRWSTEIQRVESDKQQLLDERRERFMTSFTADLAKARKGAGDASDIDEKMAIWNSFTAKYDGTFEGRVIEAMIPMITEAKGAIRKLEIQKQQDARIAAEKIRAVREANASLLATLGNAELNAVAKAKAAAEFVDQHTATASDAGVAAEVEEMLQKARGESETWRLAAAAATPEEPLKLDGLFAESAYASYSENGQKRILKQAQTQLKAAGVYDGTPDGTPGAKTHQALIAYQTQAELIASAALDQATLAALELEAIEDNPAPPVAQTRRTGGGGGRSPAESPSGQPIKNAAKKGTEGVKKGLKKGVGFLKDKFGDR